jgi:urease subunit alpha
VLWRPEFFGVKPELVIKGGYPAWGALGDGNASIAQAEPQLYAPHWGGSGLAAASLSIDFVSAVAAAGGFRRRIGTRRRAIPVVGTRQVGKRHMLYNQANPRIEIDPGSAEVRIDGQPLPPLPDEDLPLNRRYFLL